MSLTPILDLEQGPPKAKRPWKTLILVTPISSAVFLAPLVAEKLMPGAPPFNVLLWLPAIYFGIAFHEIGHLVAGKLAGMEPGGIYVGGFWLSKSGQRWIFRFDFRQSLLCGFAKPLPAKNDFRRDHFAWMVAGGPIATVLFTAICAFTVARFGGGTWAWIGTLFWGATFGLVSFIPYSSGGIKSDTLLIWELLTHPERSRCWMSLLALQTQEANGVLPRDWDPNLMREVLDTDEKGAYYAYIQMLAFYRHLDQRNTPAALQHLENALVAASRGGNKQVRRWCFREAAFASASERKSAVQARVWLERACKIEKPESTADIEAEIAMAESRYNDALQHWAAARDFLSRNRLDSGLVRFAKERHAEREEVCRVALSVADVAPLRKPSDLHETSSLNQPQPFPWMTVAAIALVGIIILVAVTSR